MELPITNTLIDITRVTILIITLFYASKLDISDRIVPHRTWIIPILLGNLLILIQTVQTVSNQILHIAYGIVAITIFTSLLVTTQKIYQDKQIRQEVWAIPITITLLLLTIQLTLFSQPQNTTTLLLTILTNIALAIIVGLFLHLFPNIGMGGADFVAIVTIGFLLPVHPEIAFLPYELAPTVPFPEAIITLPILNVITNTAFLVLIYLPLLPIKNILVGKTESPFLTAFTVDVPLSDLHTKHGRVIPTWKLDEATFFQRIKIYFSGLDTFFLQEYFEWRQTVSATEVTSFEDETDIFLERFLNNHREVFDYDEDEGWDTNNLSEDEEFMKELLKQDTVRLMPGLPFIVPLFAGVLLLITIGDLLFIFLLFLASLA